MDGYSLADECAAPDDPPELWTDRSADGVRYFDEMSELDPDNAVLIEAERFQTRIGLPEAD